MEHEQREGCRVMLESLSDKIKTTEENLNDKIDKIEDKIENLPAVELLVSQMITSNEKNTQAITDMTIAIVKVSDNMDRMTETQNKMTETQISMKKEFQENLGKVKSELKTDLESLKTEFKQDKEKRMIDPIAILRDFIVKFTMPIGFIGMIVYEISKYLIK